MLITVNQEGVYSTLQNPENSSTHWSSIITPDMLHGTFVLCGTKNYLFSYLQEQQKEMRKKVDELGAKFNKITLPSVPKHLQPRSK